MAGSTRRTIQILLSVLLVIAAARLVWILYQRGQRAREPAGEAPAARTVNPDYFVYPPRAHLTDFRSVEKLAGQTLWVRDGWRYGYFPYDSGARRTREIQDPPLLPPLQPVKVSTAVSGRSSQPGVREVNLVFEMPGRSGLHSITVGHCGPRADSCRFYLDEMFFLKDPRELYSYWKPEVWESVEKGEVREGMTEAQVSFALGFGRLLTKESRERDGRVVRFEPPGRAPVMVVFNEDGYARSVEEVTSDKTSDK